MHKTNRKLNLGKETLKSLSGDALSRAAGGGLSTKKRCTTVSESDMCPTTTKDTIPIYSDASCVEVGCTVVGNP
jgi:hypothetical protein